MRDRLEEFAPDVVVAVVTFTDRSTLAEYQRGHDLPFAVVTDADRSGYRSFGLGRGSIRRVWGARAARRYGHILRRNGWRGLARPTEDTLQLGGDFVIAPDGTLAWAFFGKGPDDRPSVDQLIAAVATIG